MSDATLELLRNSITLSGAQPESELFIADENVDDNPMLLQFARAMQVITNRFNNYTVIEQTGPRHCFSDFDFSHINDATLQRIYYRTSKEKAVVHHVINAAARLLKTGGELILAGEKHQGIQTYIKKAEQRLGGEAVVEKDGPARIGVIQKKSVGEILDDSDYATLRPAISTDDIVFHSKPGVFGWQKIDQGSAFMASQLAIAPIKNNRLLDLGCGYGYISVMAQKYQPALTHATDNNAAAVLACKKNFALNNITGDVIVDHIGASLAPEYDVVLCNPPFHQGFDVEHSLTHDFVAASSRLLRREGQALFVTNSFVALERVAAKYFTKVHAIADNKQFKVVLLTEPLRFVDQKRPNPSQRVRRLQENGEGWEQ